MATVIAPLTGHDHLSFQFCTASVWCSVACFNLVLFYSVGHISILSTSPVVVLASLMQGGEL